MILDLYHLKSDAVYLYSDVYSCAEQNTDSKIQVLLKHGAREFILPQFSSSSTSTSNTLLQFCGTRIQGNKIQCIFERFKTGLKLNTNEIKYKLENTTTNSIQWYPSANRYYTALKIQNVIVPLTPYTINFLSSVCTMFGCAYWSLSSLNTGDMWIRQKNGWYNKSSVVSRCTVRDNVYPYLTAYWDDEFYYGALGNSTGILNLNCLVDFCNKVHPSLFEFI